MKILKSKKLDSKIEIKLVDEYLNQNKEHSENDRLNHLAKKLNDLGALQSDTLAIINRVGIAQGWIVTAEMVDKKIISEVKGNDFKNFYDVISFVEKMSIHNTDKDNIFNKVVKLAKLEASTFKQNSKYSKLFKNSQNHGKVCNWVLANPLLGLHDLLKADIISTTSKKEDYYHEVYAYIYWVEHTFLPARNKANLAKKSA